MTLSIGERESLAERAELRTDLMSTPYEQVTHKKVIYIDLPPTDNHQNHIMGKVCDEKDTT